MKNIGKLALGVALVLFVGLGAVASANTVSLYNNSYTASPGGEFTAISSSLDPTTLGYSTLAENTIVVNSVAETGFETFCLENTVTFSQGTAYNYSVQQAIIPQGGSLSLGVAWLYSQFAAGTLADYYYSSGANGSQNGGNWDFATRKGAAAVLQQTIWYLQGEIKINQVSNQVFLNLLETSTNLSLTSLESAAGGAYGVAVLDLTNQTGTSYAQDQLVLNPSSNGNTAGVPDGGATVTLLGMAFAGIAYLKRKKQA